MRMRCGGLLGLVTLMALAGPGAVLAGGNPGKGRGKGKKVGQSDEKPPGWRHGKKEGWEGENPPGWGKWTDAKRQQWKQGLKQAKDAIRKHMQERLHVARGRRLALRKTMRKHMEEQLHGALRALEMVARKGVPFSHAQAMAMAGLERGLGPLDFEPLGRYVAEKHGEGLKGEELSNVIHKEVERRRQKRQKAREEMKRGRSVEGRGKPGGQHGKGTGRGKEKTSKEEDKGKGGGKGRGKGR